MMEQKTVFLHIGPPKTGSTSIQSMLDEFQQTFLNLGILYPSTGRLKADEHLWIRDKEGRRPVRGAMKAHHCLAWETLNQIECIQTRSYWTDVIEEIQRSDARTVVISSEMFSSLSVPDIRVIRKHLHDYNVEVVMYLRDPFARMLSGYTQNVKKGRYFRSLKRFLEERMEDVFPYADIIRNWESAFRRDHIRINVLDNLKGEHALERNFILSIDRNTIDFNHCYKEQPSNSSPTPGAVRLLRCINFVEHLLRRPERLRTAFNKLRHYVMNGMQRSQSITRLTGWLLHKPLFSEVYRESIHARFGAHYAALVGEPSDPFSETTTIDSAILLKSHVPKR